MLSLFSFLFFYINTFFAYERMLLLFSTALNVSGLGATSSSYMVSIISSALSKSFVFAQHCNKTLYVTAVRVIPYSFVIRVHKLVAFCHKGIFSLPMVKYPFTSSTTAISSGLHTPPSNTCSNTFSAMSKSRPAMHAAMHVDAARASGSIPWSLPKDTSKSTADDGAFLLTQSRSFLVTSLKI